MPIALVAAFVWLLAVPITAASATFDCTVTHRQNITSVVPKAHLDMYHPSVVIHDGQEPSLERCSLVPSQGQVTCDTYAVDNVTYDKNVDLKKFYVFKSQFDVQLFPDLTFVENNGRGGISFGSCKLIGLD